MNADVSYRDVGRLVVDFDADGNIIPASYDADVSGVYPFPTGDDLDFVSLTNGGGRSGNATFADDGTEQDAFAEYLLADHAMTETAFDDADTGRDMDSRIVSLAWQDGLALDTAVDEFLFAA
ncbi:hypothetical protein MU516_10140 [Paracoccus sp. YLB-12]|uniref:Uncharacterized protein n=1 Tax=Paracoccus maritimus TaxID=2933292 RepID=A0ABT2KB56_9RHOB|nr:hypothetical protein [Paracoccus sp. YLB-12]MCT4333224.1 hypothetical protein [Paracoccus sp. YLB-12]